MKYIRNIIIISFLLVVFSILLLNFLFDTYIKNEVFSKYVVDNSNSIKSKIDKIFYQEENINDIITNIKSIKDLQTISNYQLYFSKNQYVYNDNHEYPLLNEKKIFRLNDTIFDNNSYFAKNYLKLKNTVLVTYNKEYKGDKLIILLYYHEDSYINYFDYYKIITFLVIALLFSFSALELIRGYFSYQDAVSKQYEDYSSLKELKRKADIANQEKSEFLANISHELRTPLNAIIGFSSIMKEEQLGPIENSTYKEYIGDINYSGSHLLTLINEILDYSKAESGKLSVDLKPTDLNKVINNSIRIIHQNIDKNGLKLIFDAPKDHIAIMADAKRLKQVFLNILSNSIKFTDKGGEIKIDVSRKDEIVSVCISDNGIGISDFDIAKALSTFGQIDSSLSKKHAGTGLGLPLTKALVELMGGDFTINSEENLGTSIIMNFKIIQH